MLLMWVGSEFQAEGLATVNEWNSLYTTFRNQPVFDIFHTL